MLDGLSKRERKFLVSTLSETLGRYVHAEDVASEVGEVRPGLVASALEEAFIRCRNIRRKRLRDLQALDMRYQGLSCWSKLARWLGEVRLSLQSSAASKQEVDERRQTNTMTHDKSTFTVEELHDALMTIWPDITSSNAARKERRFQCLFTLSTDSIIEDEGEDGRPPWERIERTLFTETTEFASSSPEGLDTSELNGALSDSGGIEALLGQCNDPPARTEVLERQKQRLWEEVSRLRNENRRMRLDCSRSARDDGGPPAFAFALRAMEAHAMSKEPPLVSGGPTTPSQEARSKSNETPLVKESQSISSVSSARSSDSKLLLPQIVSRTTSKIFTELPSQTEEPTDDNYTNINAASSPGGRLCCPGDVVGTLLSPTQSDQLEIGYGTSNVAVDISGYAECSPSRPSENYDNECNLDSITVGSPPSNTIRDQLSPELLCDHQDGSLEVICGTLALEEHDYSLAVANLGRPRLGSPASSFGPTPSLPLVLATDIAVSPLPHILGRQRSCRQKMKSPVEDHGSAFQDSDRHTGVHQHSSASLPPKAAASVTQMVADAVAVAQANGMTVEQVASWTGPIDFLRAMRPADPGGLPNATAHRFTSV